MKVAVLMGGKSTERLVSLESGKGVLKALLNQGYQAFALDIPEQISGLVDLLEEQKPDVVFNALHGRYGEDGCIQGLLNLMEIPYTHSGVLASALSMDKQRAKVIVASMGIDVPRGYMITKEQLIHGNMLSRPYILKPNDEGSSVGVHIIRTDEDERRVIDEWSYNKPVLTEEYIAGREVSVVVMDDGAVGVVEIVPHTGFYDYHTKYTSGEAEHIVPADISGEWTKKLMQQAYKIHQALGCRGVSRSDFRLDEQTGRCVFLEINVNPGLTPLSLVPEVVSKIKGMSYEDLIVQLIRVASYEK